MQMGYSDASSRSSSRDNENFLSGIGTEVIYLVPDSLALNVKDGYQNLVTFEDRALTDIDTNIVILNLPLDTPLKIYAYRFEDAYSLSDIDSVVRTPLSFGISGSFIITSATTSITVSLSITPNGEPGIQIEEPTTSINNLGGSGTFTIKLNTHPFHQVTIPISVDNTSIATISPESVSFTPTNWSDTKTVTITGKTDVNYSDNTTLGVSIGPTSSDDSDYNQITETFTLVSKSSPPSSDNLSRGLVAFYRFNGNANDNTSNANNGTVSGAILTKGKDNVSNTAYKFDGVDDYIELPTGLLSGSGDFSISLWINTTASSQSRILQQRDANGYNGEYMLDLKSDGKLIFKTYRNGYKWSGTSSSVVNDANWHQISIVQEDNGGRFYLNGNLESFDNNSGKVHLLSTLKTFLGGDKRDDNKFFNGKIDKLRIYNRALTSLENSLLYTSDNTNSTNN